MDPLDGIEPVLNPFRDLEREEAKANATRENVMLGVEIPWRGQTLERPTLQRMMLASRAGVATEPGRYAGSFDDYEEAARALYVYFAPIGEVRATLCRPGKGFYQVDFMILDDATWRWIETAGIPPHAVPEGLAAIDLMLEEILSSQFATITDKIAPIGDEGNAHGQDGEPGV